MTGGCAGLCNGGGERTMVGVKQISRWKNNTYQLWHSGFGQTFVVWAPLPLHIDMLSSLSYVLNFIENI